MFAVCAIALLCLVSAGLSAPLSCEDLVRPLDQMGPRHLESRRALVAGSVSDRQILELFKKRDSAAFALSNKTSHVSFDRSLRLDGECQYSSYNISLNGSSFTFDWAENRTLTSSFIYTSCHDCVLILSNVESEKRLHFYLFSKRRELELKEKEEFEAQVKCLQMPPPAWLDPTKELCPDQPTTEPTAAQTEEQTEKPKD